MVASLLRYRSPEALAGRRPPPRRHRAPSRRSRADRARDLSSATGRSSSSSAASPDRPFVAGRVTSRASSQRFRDRADFAFVYIAEAHAANEWQLAPNLEEGAVLDQQVTLEERRAPGARDGRAPRPDDAALPGRDEQRRERGLRGVAGAARRRGRERGGSPIRASPARAGSPRRKRRAARCSAASRGREAASLPRRRLGVDEPSRPPDRLRRDVLAAREAGGTSHSIRPRSRLRFPGLAARRSAMPPPSTNEGIDHENVVYSRGQLSPAGDGRTIATAKGDPSGRSSLPSRSPTTDGGPHRRDGHPARGPRA